MLHNDHRDEEQDDLRDHNDQISSSSVPILQRNRQPDSQEAPLIPITALYAVHAFCTFDERIYEFASYFFLIEIFKTTLLPMSVYGFSTTVAGILLSTAVGVVVDRMPRLNAVQFFLTTQKLSTVLGYIGFWALLEYFDASSLEPCLNPQDNDRNDLFPTTLHFCQGSMTLYQGYSIFAFLVVISGVLKLSALGWSISIERDWIVCLCQSSSEALTRINVSMKRIDLACKLVAPLIFAAILAEFGAGYCALTLAVWCLISFSVELTLVRRIWTTSPVLWRPRTVHPSANTGRHASQLKHGRSRTESQQSEQENHEEGLARANSPEFASLNRNQNFEYQPFKLLERGLSSFEEYYYHIVFLASLSYAIIYINLMSVSGTMIGYLQWRGFSAGSIATLKGICTAAELLGTHIMPMATRYLGLVRTGAWSIWLEVITLTPVVFSIYSDILPVQVAIFAGMALSRVGVWSFDLVITQTMQEYISDSHGNAGMLNGWHFSMMSIFELGQYVLTMIWSEPKDYYIPCTLSFACVIVGAIVYSTYVTKIRGHLFHYRRLASTASSYLSVDHSNPSIHGVSSGYESQSTLERTHDNSDSASGHQPHRRLQEIC